MKYSYRNWLSKVAAFALLVGVTNSYAAPATYNFLITGEVLDGADNSGPNAYGLNSGDTITAYGIFTADLGTIGNETGAVSFGLGSGNTMTIDLNGTLITAADDTDFGSGAYPLLAFNSGLLWDFDFESDFSSPDFGSSFLFFDDFSDLFGEWSPTATLTPVPVPAAIWLFGSSLIGLLGLRRRQPR